MRATNELVQVYGRRVVARPAVFARRRGLPPPRLNYRRGHVPDRLRRRSLSEVNGKFHRVSTKTFASRRLPMPAEVERRLPASGDGLVFSTTYGNPVRSAAFRSRVFLPACQRADVRPLRNQDMGDTCASQLMGSGASRKRVQSWLGHSDLRLTMNTYTHAYAQDAEQAAQRLTRLVSHHTHIP